MDGRGPNTPILDESNFLTSTELLTAIDGGNDENTLREAPVVLEGASELNSSAVGGLLVTRTILAQGEQQLFPPKTRIKHC